MVSYHLALLVAYRYSASGDITYLIIHMNSKDHVIIGSCDFMGGRFLWYATTLTKLLAIEILIKKI